MSDNAITTQDPRIASTLNMIAEAARDPNVDVAKLRMLMEMQRDFIADQSKLAFLKALSDAQAEMLPVVRSSRNEHTKSNYAKLEAIDQQIRPIYVKHGFSPSFDSEDVPGKEVTVVCHLSHRDGYVKSYRLSGAADGTGSGGKATKTAIHAVASTVTYLRRYLLCMIFNVVLVDDDDGNRAGMKFISGAEQDELDTLLRETKTDEYSFLQIMTNGARSISEIEARDFVRLKNGLLQKRQALAAKQSKATEGSAT